MYGMANCFSNSNCSRTTNTYTGRVSEHSLASLSSHCGRSDQSLQNTDDKRVHTANTSVLSCHNSSNTEPLCKTPEEWAGLVEEIGTKAPPRPPGGFQRGGTPSHRPPHPPFMPTLVASGIFGISSDQAQMNGADSVKLPNVEIQANGSDTNDRTTIPPADSHTDSPETVTLPEEGRENRDKAEKTHGSGVRLKTIAEELRKVSSPLKMRKHNPTPEIDEDWLVLRCAAEVELALTPSGSRTDIHHAWFDISKLHLWREKLKTLFTSGTQQVSPMEPSSEQVIDWWNQPAASATVVPIVVSSSSIISPSKPKKRIVNVAPGQPLQGFGIGANFRVPTLVNAEFKPKLSINYVCYTPNA